MPESYQYRLSALAKEDLKRIYLYGVANFGTEQADSYFYELFQMFQLIADNPFMFQSIDHIRPGYRRCMYKSDHIYFRLNEQHIDIMALIGAQSIDLWLP